jgi:putative ATPase
VITAIDSAIADVRRGLTGTVPPHLRDAHYAGSERLGHTGYRYPHDFPGRVVAQQYAPDPVVGREYYSPGDLGVERVAKERLTGLREVLRGDRDVTPEDVAQGFRPRQPNQEEH